jgi:Ca2+-binding RTX toxin-like protein
MAEFTAYTGTGDSTLTSALLAANSGIIIDANSIVLGASGQNAVNFYDGSLAPLGIGSGLLLTSGTTPGTSNTLSWFGQDNNQAGDADINAVVNAVFQTQSYDATTLSFDFTVADPTATSVSFDLVFGSDEYPEWVDQFVDSAIVMVNGVNYALFNHDPMHPLSVVSSNLAAGYFQDNAGNVLPIEYDGVSHVLKIVAPIQALNPDGTPFRNHIKIGIADTGDHIYDSGIFIANLSAGTIPGSGVVATPDVSCTDGADSVSGTSMDEYFLLKGGDDQAYAGAGAEWGCAGAGHDTVFGGSGADELKGDAGNDWLDGGDGSDTAVFAGASTEYSVSAGAGANSLTVLDSKAGASSEGSDSLTNVEFAKFSDGLFTLGPTGLGAVINPGPPPANLPGLVVISGIGSLGNTLGASVSDPNGVASAVSYQWQVSGNGGASWSDVGLDNGSYTVAAGDVGKSIQVLASYVDAAGNAESPMSAQKSILDSGGGDLVVTLMQLTAPAGANTIHPLTTLVQDAIDLGLSPNMAALTIKTVLGVPGEVKLQSYDAYALLQANPYDPVALAVEKIAVQVAILTSLSDDDTAMGLTVAILDAAANNQTLDLADVDDLSAILGVAAVLDPLTGKYPQPLEEILDRNLTMADAIADGQGVAAIEAQWQDLLSIQDGIASTSIADLSIHVNQAPSGTAIASLAGGQTGLPYTVSASDLLQGFSDPDGGTLAVSELSADNGVVLDNLDGTWTVTAGDSYVGPIELSYTISDGQGGSAIASQLFVIEATIAVNSAPTGSATASLGDGSEDQAYAILASDLLAGFSDADGDSLNVANLAADDGAVLDNGDGSFTVTPTANHNGTVTLSYDVSDGQGGTVAASLSYQLAAVNDAPLGTASALLPNGTENSPYLASADSLLQGFSDVDGDTLAVSGLSADHATVVANADGSFTLDPALNFSGMVSLSYSVTDGHGGSQAASQSIDFTPLPGITLTGSAKADNLVGGAHNDTINGLAGNDTLDGSGGDDLMAGGSGNDSYVVDSNGDVVVESAGAGTDLVRASISFTLGANLENLTLTGSAAIDATGNTVANILAGNGADNLLDGGAGADKMAGGGGNDNYVVDSAGDAVTENAGAGTDSVLSSLAAYTLGANVENLRLGSLAPASGTGNSLGNALWGNAAANVLSGLAGNDTLDGGAGIDKLIGGAGNDVLTGGLDADTFRFEKIAFSALTNLDQILDFDPLADSIELENGIFRKLAATGSLSDANFRASADGTAADADDYILYDTDSGALSYDADGNGAGAAVQFVTLVGLPDVTAADFLVT